MDHRLLLLLGLAAPLLLASACNGDDGDDDDSASDDDDDDDDDSTDDDDATPETIEGPYSGEVSLLHHVYKSRPPELECTGSGSWTVDAAGALSGTATCEAFFSVDVSLTFTGSVDAAGAVTGSMSWVDADGNDWTEELSGSVTPGSPLTLTWAGWFITGGNWRNYDGEASAQLL
jgi:hypothetical protein